MQGHCWWRRCWRCHTVTLGALDALFAARVGFLSSTAFAVATAAVAAAAATAATAAIAAVRITVVAIAIMLILSECWALLVWIGVVHGLEKRRRAQLGRGRR